MKSIVLKGQIIKISSKVRFVDDRNLYKDYDVNKPMVGQVYTVRGFTKKSGFLLEEVKNYDVEWTNANGDIDDVGEPGFASWRFEPAQPILKKKMSKKKVKDAEMA